MNGRSLTPQSVLDGALAALGRPPKLAAMTGDLYTMMEQQLEHYQNRLGIHDGNFFLKKRSVTLPSGRLEISIDEEAWGRPVWCDLDPAFLPSGSILPRRDVDLVAIQDLERYRTGILPMSGNASVATDGNKVLSFAQAVAWYREGTRILFFFDFGGYRPATDTHYRFFFQPGGLSTVIEDEEIEWLPNFVALLQLDCTLAFLPLSDIPEPRYTRLQTRIERDLMRRQAALDEYLQNDHTEQSGPYSGYNRNRLGGHLSAR